MNIPNTRDRSVQQHPNGLINAIRRTSVGTLLAVGIAGSAFAQTAPAPAPTDNSVLQLPEVNVTGYQQSLTKALNEKRASLDNIDVITAQDVGKFPDTNLAEALSHIPGVTIDRLFGDGERVSILGTDPNLNRTLLNGEPIATADWYILDTPSRQFNYVLLAPEVIGDAEVYRTSEARLLEGSIGGTIIVNTLDPLKGKAFSAAASVTESYNSFSKQEEPNFSATVSWHNPSKTIGILVGAEDQKEYIRRDGIEALSPVGNAVDANGIVIDNRFTPASGLPQAGVVGGPANAGFTQASSFYADEVINTALFEQVRHRTGANVALELRPNDRIEIDLTGLYVDEQMNNANSSYYTLTPFAYDNGATAPPYVDAPTVSISNGIITSMNQPAATGSSSTVNAAEEIDLFYRLAEIKTQDYDLKVTYKGDGFTVTPNFGFTRATGGTKDQFYFGQNPQMPFSMTEGASSASFTITNPDGNYRNDGGANINIAVPAPNQSSGAGWATYGSLVQEPEVDSEQWAQVDVEVPLAGVLKKLLFGARFSDHTTSQSTRVQHPFYVDSVNRSGHNIGPTLETAPSNFLAGLPGVTTSMSTHPVVNPGAIEQIIGLTGATGFDLVSGWYPGLVAGENLEQYTSTHPNEQSYVWIKPNAAGQDIQSPSTGPNFSGEESIGAAYLESEFSSGPLSGNFGLRFVQTSTTGWSEDLNNGYWDPTTSKFSVSSDGNSATVQVVDYVSTDHISETYDNILPSINAAYDVSRDQTLRFAMSEVISRPNLLQEFPYTSLYPFGSAAAGNGVGGTLGLNPYKSYNLDADYEWYFAPNSYFAVDLFYKDISNYIENETNAETHQDTSEWAGIGEFEITRPSNGGKASSEGVALSYQQAFAGGFGLSANYTRLRAEGQNGPLPFSSKDQVNIGPYFENRFGLIRLTYSWRDDFATGSFNGSTTVFTRPYTELDANAQINITKNFSILLTARNLTDELYQQYFALPNGAKLFADVYRVGPEYSAGLHFSF